VGDAADDVRAIADAFALERFAVLGRSGGGPHALACAALLPERVTRVASLVGLAPYDAKGLNWFQGMVDLNRQQYTAARIGARNLAGVLYPQVVAMRANPEHLVKRLEAEASLDDRTTLRDPDYRATFIANLYEAVARSIDGWAADSLAFTSPWGFEPDWISVPTVLWHDTWDMFSPVAHARWLAERIKGALLMLSDRGSHLSVAVAQREAIRWLVQGGTPNFAA
jgi:pimeloyl-ACP methyl ester carboxylesterase